jgi:flagellar biosynthetic protein FliR
MLTLSGDWLNQYVVWSVLMSIRILGVFLTMPLFAFKALNLRLRVVISLVLAYFVSLYLPHQNLPGDANFTILSVPSEFAIGLLCGWVMRVGLMSLDMLAETLSMQAGLSFAASITHDPAMSSGLLGEFLGLIAIALTFALNIHLVFLQVILQSFDAVPVGQWLSVWRPGSVVKLLGLSFALGMVLTLPAMVVYYLFNLTQAVLARVSPQMNLFSVGFSLMVPLMFAIIALLLPGLPDWVIRTLGPAQELVQAWLTRAN